MVTQFIHNFGFKKFKSFQKRLFNIKCYIQTYQATFHFYHSKRTIFLREIFTLGNVRMEPPFAESHKHSRKEFSQVMCGY